MSTGGTTNKKPQLVEVLFFHKLTMGLLKIGYEKIPNFSFTKES